VARQLTVLEGKQFEAILKAIEEPLRAGNPGSTP